MRLAQRCLIPTMMLTTLLLPLNTPNCPNAAAQDDHDQLEGPGRRCRRPGVRPRWRRRRHRTQRPLQAVNGRKGLSRPAVSWRRRCDYTQRPLRAVSEIRLGYGSMASAPPPHPTSAPGREQPQRTQPACSFVASALPLHPTSALGRERMIRRHAVCDGCRFNIYAGAGPCMRASAGPQLAAAWHDAGGLLAYMDFQSAVESLDSGAAAVSTPSGSGC